MRIQRTDSPPVVLNPGDQGQLGGIRSQGQRDTFTVIQKSVCELEPAVHVGGPNLTCSLL